MIETPSAWPTPSLNCSISQTTQARLSVISAGSGSVCIPQTDSVTRSTLVG